MGQVFVPIKRIIFSVVLLIGLIVFGLLTLPFVVTPQMIKKQLNAQISRLSDETLTYKGEPSLTFNPFLGIELHQVTLKGNRQTDEEPDLLEIESLQFGVKILPILFGKIRFSEFKLIRPRFNLYLREDGSANWTSTAKTTELLKPLAVVEGAAANSAAQPGRIKLGDFDIVDAIVEARVVDHGSPIRISNLNAKLRWPNLASSWNIKGKGIWRGEQIEFSNFAGNPLALFTSGKSPIRARLSSPSLNGSFDGMAIMVGGMQLHGSAKVATPSLPRLYEMFVGENKQTTLPIGDIKIEGNVRANAHEVRFDDVVLGLGSNVATGNMQLNWNNDARPKISGTLAFSSLDVSPIVNALLPVRKSANKDKKYEFGDNFFDLDMRFSATNYSIQQNQFAQLAASAIIKKGEWFFEIGEADFFDGMIAGTIGLKNRGEKSEIEIKGVMRDISMEGVTRELFGSQVSATGKANVNFSLKSPDKTSVTNPRDLSGSVKLTMASGVIEGVDLVKAMEALQNNDGFVSSEESSGSTEFSELTLDMLIYNGIGWITQGNASGVENNYRLSGKADLLSGGLAITADISKVPSEDGVQQSDRIFIGGTAKNPLVMRSPLIQPRY